MSSNVANEGFYNSLGFTTVARLTLGEDNPTWDKPPVPVDIVRKLHQLLLATLLISFQMVRKPQSKISVAEKPSGSIEDST